MRARLAVLIGSMLLFASCVGADPSNGGGGPVPLGDVRLLAFSSCDDFLSYVRDRGVEHVTAWGLPGQWWGPWMRGVPALAAEDATVGGAPGAAPLAGVDYSTTNLQTAGVDEPDIVKTDGELIVALAQGKLFVVDVTGPTPVLRGSLPLGDVWIRDLVLSGDRALLLGESGGRLLSPVMEAPISDAYGFGGPVSALIEVDLSSPDDPRIVHQLLVDGRYLSARMVDGVARVVVSSYPTGLRFEGPDGPGLRAERAALERNREIVRASTIENWVPYYVLEDAGGATLGEGSLLDCSSARRPPEFAGFGMVTVLTVDLAEGLAGFVPQESVGVLSDGETVYASVDSLYVATQRWMDWQRWEAATEGERESLAEGQVTQIHRFDVTGDGGAAYRSSGEVPGWLLNQFSMDEYGGYLRVASTDAPTWWDGDSESMVTVLADDGAGALTEVGRVSGLGQGERIFAVRFLGELGYVVTFRQVDPLYVLDLADPTAPRVTGELKIQGYSAYLHPLGEGRLLGVGQDATGQGAVQGTQLSIFDVSDPADPRRIDQVKIADASSEAEWDHHAFLYWEPAGLVVVPLNVYAWDDVAQVDRSFYGAQAIRIEGDHLEIAARLAQPEGGAEEWGPGIRRSLVVGDRLYTVSEGGIESLDLASLEDVAWVAFR
jgi:uncharacterized secreted protein with C-terminal beta-propeller domain